MSQKIYYDSVNNKEVVDVSGLKLKADIIAEFGLDASTQDIEISDPDFAHEVVGGVLQSFNAKTRGEGEAVSREAARMGKETATKAKLGLSDAEFADLKDSLA